MSLIKHSAFAQEREVRLVRIVTGDFTEPRHRVSSLGIVPYVQLEHIGAEADDHRLPLAGAHLGPIHHPEPAEIGLRSLLNTHGYTDAEAYETRPRPVNDTWIAACCLAEGLPLATFNTKDFADFATYDGLHLVDVA